jgi:serine/threonine-protein kinase
MALPNKTKIPVGTVLAGKYKITREIGRGGMAAVYEAANVDIGKRVAIKVLAQELTTSAVVVERFLREARAAAAIRSPYICDIYDSGRLDDGRPFLVLELLEGDSLYERMTKIRWLDVDTTVTVIAQVCRGLTKAHAANIVHRDLKPENIFLTKDEEGKLISKILDFGLAKFYAPMENNEKQSRLTREGAVFGTPAYMSPEQVRGQGAVDQRADLWALGCIVYECFTGRTVWSTEQGVAMTFAQIANAQLPRPATYRPDLPPGFTTWFDKALNRDITKRFQSARELSEELFIVFNKDRPEISGIGPSPALGLSKSIIDHFENPFLSSNPSTPLVREVSPEAETQPPPEPKLPQPPKSAPTTSARTSISSPSSGATAAESTDKPHEAPGGPPSPRASKLGFADGEAARAPKRGFLRAVAFFLGAAALGGAGFLAWKEIQKHPTQGGTGTPGTTAPTGSGSADPNAAAGSASTAPAPAAEPSLSWVGLVRDGQQAIAAGDYKQATKLIKDAFDKGGGHGVPRTLLEHLGVAASGGTGATCKLTGLARPRAYDLVAGSHPPLPSGRPSIAVGPHGAVVTWSDAHEGNEHAYAVGLDDALRDTGVPVDVTPEGTQVARPTIERAGDKLVLVYTDGHGSEPGVHVRWLDADGHIAGPAAPVSSPKAMAGATIAPAPDGFYVGWTEEVDADSEDLFFRHLGPALEPLGDASRATDFVPTGPTKARARWPSIAVSSGALLATFKLERDPNRLIEHLRVPLADVGKSLGPLKKNERKADRNIGEMALVNVDKAKADGPVLKCGGAVCFLVWHGESGGGAWAAFIDSSSAQPLLHRHFAKQGQHPGVAVAPSGQALVAWYESGKILVAPITKDGGVGTPSKIARISGEQPMPSIAPGPKPGEWYLAWLDYETGHLETYAARVLCR